MIVYWEDMELYTIELPLWGFRMLIHIEAVVPLKICLEQEWPQHGAHKFWENSGGIQEESPY